MDIKPPEKQLLDVMREVLGEALSPLTAWTLRFHLRNPYESLIVVDKNARIAFMDEGSEHFLNLPKGGSVGQNVTQLVPESDLPRVLETGAPSIGRVFNIRGIRRIGSTYPLIRDGEIIGALGRVIFRSLEEMDRVNREVSNLKSKIRQLTSSEKSQYNAYYGFENILGISGAIRRTIELAKRVAPLDTDVLLFGESGTGKELFAQAIHNFVNPGKPFVRVNSPAIPFDLAESELFGYEKGAFSGANPAGRRGKFELAHNGTVFLDEISSLPLTIQGKILRVLQEREVDRLGSSSVKKVKFKLVAATNVDLKKLVLKGKFRNDLYYRIAKASIQIPPLRERKEDIPIYVDYYLKKINERFSTNFLKLSDEAFNLFMEYHWPGNVRELINTIEQAVLKQWAGDEITSASLPSDMTGYGKAVSSTTDKPIMWEIKEMEKETIVEVIKATNGNKRQAALMLGISRSTLYKKIKQYKI